MKKWILLWIENIFLFAMVVCMISIFKDEDGTPVFLMILSHYIEYLTILFKKASFDVIMVAMAFYTGIAILFHTFIRRVEKKEKKEKSSKEVE